MTSVEGSVMLLATKMSPFILVVKMNSLDSQNPPHRHAVSRKRTDERMVARFVRRIDADRYTDAGEDGALVPVACRAAAPVSLSRQGAAVERGVEDLGRRDRDHPAALRWRHV